MTPAEKKLWVFENHRCLSDGEIHFLSKDETDCECGSLKNPLPGKCREHDLIAEVSEKIRKGNL